MRLCKITSLVPTGVSIDDLGVHLAGKGSHATVSSDSVNLSRDLRANSHLVCVDSVPEVNMPVWPFIKAPEPAPTIVRSPDKDDLAPILAELREMGKSVKDITAILATLRDLPAAHADARSPVPVGVPQEEPMFAPSRIDPGATDFNLKIQHSESEDTDFEASKDALRRLRRPG